MSGTVNISRSIWRDVAFKQQAFTEREAFMWMIMEASYKARERRIGAVTVQLERGQLACAIRFMAEAWGWTKSTVDRFLKRLENRDMIGTDSGTGVNVITICKYDEYQNKPKDGGTPEFEKRDSSGTAAGQQRDKPNTELIPDANQMKEANASVVSLPDGVSDCLVHFNATAERVGWPKVQKFTKPRRAALSQRIADVGGAENWCEAITRAAASPLLTGQTGRGWIADFDWLAKPANFTKLLEGNYDPRDQHNSQSARPGANRATENLMAGFAAVAARHSGGTQ